MTVLPILTWPDPRLSQVCAPVGDALADAKSLAQDMLDTMYAAPGRGLAAPQVGAMLRMFVMDATWKEGVHDPMVFVDPVITRQSEERATNAEGCLSIPGVETQVTRAAEIDVAWRSLDGAMVSGKFTGFAAACVQHEIDHLDGTVTLDHLTEDQRKTTLENYKGLT